MRKIVILAAMLAMMLVAAAPAFAHEVVGGDVDVLVVDASQSATVDASQTGTAVAVGGVATATSGDATLGGASGAEASADATAEVSNELDVSVEQVNGGFGSFFVDPFGFIIFF